MDNKIEISKDGYLKLIQKVFENKLEERELALDRYRKADEQMESAEQFTLMGKSAVAFLNLASVSTNDMASLAKEIKSIAYKDEGVGDVNINLSEDWKMKIQEGVEEAEKRRTIISDNNENE